MDDTNRRGRKPAGPKYVQHLQGSAQTKQRVQLILETMTGTRRVQDACAELKISATRFYQVREEFLQGGLTRVEGKAAGRPRRPATAAAVEALQEQVTELALELKASRLREEIALILPGARQGAAEPQKKTTERPQRRARPRWWKK